MSGRAPWRVGLRAKASSSSCASRWCHVAGGEVYFVAFTRTSVRISSYEDDAIQNTIETWADGVAVLA